MAQTQLLRLSGTVSWSPASFTPASPSRLHAPAGCGVEGSLGGA